MMTGMKEQTDRIKTRKIGLRKQRERETETEAGRFRGEGETGE